MARRSTEVHLKTIKKIARDVYRTLGSGFSEDVYDRAMKVGLRLAKIPYEGQKARSGSPLRQRKGDRGTQSRRRRARRLRRAAAAELHEDPRHPLSPPHQF